MNPEKPNKWILKIEELERRVTALETKLQRATKPSVWSLNKALEIVEKRIDNLKGLGWRDAFGSFHLADKARNTLKELATEKQRLQNEIQKAAK